MNRCENLWSLGNLVRFHHNHKRQPLFGLTTGPLPGIEPQIIRPIKTIRNKIKEEVQPALA